MGYGLKELVTIAELDAALAVSAAQPILIYKHSLTCGTSGVAYEEVLELTGASILPGTAFIVPVQTSREVSRAIEQRLKIRHESPQILIVVDGLAVWHASHFRVTARAIDAAMKAIQHSAPSTPAAR